MLVVGLIPARAGNTDRLRAVLEDLGAHPRSRGEHCPGTVRCRGAGGSSPLARGTLSEMTISTRENGLIPARAGNTVFAVSHWLVLRAHPRSRGEHLVFSILTDP